MVSNGQIANQQTFNDAFVSKQALAEVVDGTINLENGSSGAVVTNVQQVINDILIVNANQDSSITNLENSRVVNSPTATDEALVRFDGTTGQSIQNSLVTVNDVGDIFTPADIECENAQINGNVIIEGDATVNGTTTFINTTNLEVTDKNILLNKNGNDASSEGAGLTVERTGTDGSIIYGNAFQNKFACGPLGAELEIATLADITAATSLDLNDLQDVNTTGVADGDVLTYDNGTSTWLPVAPVAGSSVLSVTTKTANYTATTADNVILCDSTSGTFTITLYTAVGNTGRQIIIKKTVLANTVVVDGNASETIDGALNFTLYFANDTLKLISDGANWVIDSKKMKPFTCRVYKNAGTQTINNGANNKVTFDTASYDEKSMFDNANDRIVITRPGKYLLNGAVQMASGTGEARLITAIYSASDTVVRAQNFTRGNAVGNDSSFCSTSANFTAADNVSLFLLNDLGANYNVQVGEANTFLEVIEILD